MPISTLLPELSDSLGTISPQAPQGVQDAYDMQAAHTDQPNAQPPQTPDDWAAAARRAAIRNGVDPDAFDAQMRQENNNYDPDVIYGRRLSPAGAAGIAQFMPATAAGLGIDPLNPEQALDAGAKYLKQQIDYFGGDTRKGLAAYNAGAGNVQNAVAKGGNQWESFLYPETQQYLSIITGKGGVTGSTAGNFVGRLIKKVQAENADEAPAPNPYLPNDDNTGSALGAIAGQAQQGIGNNFGNRADGTPKGDGFFGVLNRPDGGVSTELSIGVDIDGKETEIPTLVPSLTPEERTWLLSNDIKNPTQLPPSIMQKALASATQRLKAGKSPFADASESPKTPSGAGIFGANSNGFNVTDAPPDAPHKSLISSLGSTVGIGGSGPSDLINSVGNELSDVYKGGVSVSKYISPDSLIHGEGGWKDVPSLNRLRDATGNAIGSAVSAPEIGIKRLGGFLGRASQPNVDVNDPFAGIRNNIQQTTGPLTPEEQGIRNANQTAASTVLSNTVPTSPLGIASVVAPEALGAFGKLRAPGAVDEAGNLIDNGLQAGVKPGLGKSNFQRAVEGAPEEAPLSDLERTMQQSLRGKTPQVAEPPTPFARKAAMTDAGIDTTNLKTPTQIDNRWRQYQAEQRGGIGSPTENTSNAARAAYSKALEQTGDEDVAKLAARKAAAQETTSTNRVAQMNNLLENDLHAGPRARIGKSDLQKAVEQTAKEDAQPPQTIPAEWPDLQAAAQKERDAAITEFGTQGQLEAEARAGAASRAYGLPPKPVLRVPFPTAPEGEAGAAWPDLQDAARANRTALNQEERAAREADWAKQIEALPSNETSPRVAPDHVRGGPLDVPEATPGRAERVAYNARVNEAAKSGDRALLKRVMDEGPLMRQGGGPQPLKNLEPNYLGVQPQLFGNEDHNAIIEAYKTALAGRAKDLPTSIGLGRRIASRMGGDLADPYLTEMVHSESGLRHQLIQEIIKDLHPIDLRGLDPEVAQAAVDNLTKKLTAIQKEADNGVSQFRNAALDARYGNTESRSIAHGTLVARDELLAEQVPNKFDTTQNLLKEMTLGADLGVTLQQGLKAYRLGSTSLVSSAIGHAVETMGNAISRDPEALGLYPNSTISRAAQRAADGLIERGPEAVGLSRGELSSQSVVRGLGGGAKALLRPEGESAALSLVKAPVRLAARGAEALADVQYNALNKVRVQIYEGRLYQAKLLGQDISEGSQARQAAADFANLSTSTARTATDPGRALLEKRVLLSPQMTRSQFAELSQPFKVLNSPAEATSVANQLLSTTAMFGTAYAISSQVGATKSFDAFMKNTANPESPNFGKIVLQARDPQGNHLVWNFLPQFSTANAILKSFRATEALARNDQDAQKTLEQIGGAFGTYGVGRLNSGFSDLAKIGGFGYDGQGKFHWGGMSNADRAKGVVPIPLSAQSSLMQGQTDPVSIGANILGGNVYGESAYGALDRAAQARGFDDFRSATPLVQAELKADPNVQRALAANQSPYQKALEASRAPVAADTQRQEALWAQGQNDKSLRDQYHDQGTAFRQSAHDLEGQFAKQFAGFNKNAYDKAVEGYYNLSDKALNEKGDLDFDKLASLQNDYVAKLPADQQQWIKETLTVAEGKKRQTQKEYDKFIDSKKAAGYFDIDPKDPGAAAARTALDVAHPEIDAASWKYGATTGTAGGTLNTPKAVDIALADPLSKNIPVKYAGLARNIAADDGSRAAWDEYKQPMTLYYDDAAVLSGGRGVAEAASLARNTNDPAYRVSLDKMDSKHLAQVLSNTRQTLLEKHPDLDAGLLYFGYTKEGKAKSKAALARFNQLAGQYGATRPADGYTVTLAKDAK